MADIVLFTDVQTSAARYETGKKYNVSAGELNKIKYFVDEKIMVKLKLTAPKVDYKSFYPVCPNKIKYNICKCAADKSKLIADIGTIENQSVGIKI